MKLNWIMSVPVLAILSSGCTTTEQHGATGAGIGAAIGGIAGHNLGGGSGDRDKGAALGAAVGGLLGHTLGSVREEQQRSDERVARLETGSRERELWITNSNGSRSCVILRANPSGTWNGPRGEVYDRFPSEDQLRPVYGF
ncbi:MAG: glycine zipper 2TM domain-containing protein [Verrucomicrobia bacterium]|nr:glycine zipper 2TM domain-containing protein [Verrucomicrobiota bacterium]MDA1087778.1 glycine zipper 2TM domain-containing protein [Verrucomicrobiota bacterium]